MASVAVPAHQLTNWSTGLFDCCSDMHSCCLTYWCPCVAFGRISEILDKGSSSCAGNGLVFFLLQSLTGFGCLYSCIYRDELRKLFMLEGSTSEDCFVHCFCEPCALCQEYRELQNRGFDVSAGWDGNSHQYNQVVLAMAPVVEGGMKR
ncbi:hypothetical protein I3843_05G170600 [Carya illinoinensis]|uniref:Uncharacterized protein n=2 Tax=Carya illinoinensis TaxID=32201 RepID=A0A8T1QK74_CARIL|nr:protein PLANT CADMIUM RESISTANCE 3-like [Carya illinoinensis]KAG6655088.1 hypothetical protein CIPAW_05G191100 [Carya illinoinensis]KAG7980224.1 hypothetical protein I3843_05G170600 [Carya illinoinensis]